jgi:hypothetical protein
VRGDVSVLEQQRTLEVLAAVQSGTKDEMTVKESAGLAE